VEGMSLIIDLEYLQLFTNFEMGRLLCGETKSFDVGDLYQNCNMRGFDNFPFHADEFWRILHSFNDEEKDQFLQFVTGSPKPPFLGF
jgi:ubiquitin-protein ligase E3 C